jgi:hypothetical protein
VPVVAVGIVPVIAPVVLVALRILYLQPLLLHLAEMAEKETVAIH